LPPLAPPLATGLPPGQPGAAGRARSGLLEGDQRLGCPGATVKHFLSLFSFLLLLLLGCAVLLNPTLVFVAFLCCRELRVVFRAIRDAVVKKFPEDENLKYIAVV